MHRQTLHNNRTQTDTHDGAAAGHMQPRVYHVQAKCRPRALCISVAVREAAMRHSAPWVLQTYQGTKAHPPKSTL